MDKTAASCYVYAKASGMLAKTFTASKIQTLFNTSSLQELWYLLFTEKIPSVPQTVLAQIIEKKATDKFIKQYIKLISNYSKPQEIFLTLLQFFDYENLKMAAGVLSTRKTDNIEFHNIKPFNLLNYEKWPNLELLVQSSELCWYDKIPQADEQLIFSAKLDSQYIKKMWAAIEKLHGEEKKKIKSLIAKRYEMLNIIWAMRLKVYYNMNVSKIKNLLTYLDEQKSKDDVFAKEALRIASFRIDNYEDWSLWKYKSILNEPEDVKNWKLDPQIVEEKFNKEFNLHLRREFHKNAFDAMMLVSWFYIKLDELNNIRKITEAIRLNVDSTELL